MDRGSNNKEMKIIKNKQVKDDPKLKSLEEYLEFMRITEEHKQNRNINVKANEGG